MVSVVAFRLDYPSSNPSLFSVELFKKKEGKRKKSPCTAHSLV